jgi:diacylglycerol kinase (ATP)
MQNPSDSIEEQNSPRQKVVVVYNPIAGSRSSLLERTLKSLGSLGVQVALRETKGPGDGEALCREAIGRETYSAVVAAGGDGTINEVANGMQGADTPLGVIPLGTVNLLAMEIGLQKDPEYLARCIAFGPARAIKVGIVNERVFLLMVGAGLDGRVVAGVSSGLKNIMGEGAYAFSGLKEIFLKSPARLLVDVDGSEYEAAWVVVSNSTLYGGKFALAPLADLQSPGFTVSLIPGKTRCGLLRGLLRGLLAVACDRKASKGWKQLNSVNRVLIKSAQDEPSQMDGDDFAPLPLTITQAPQSLNLIFPSPEGEIGSRVTMP